MCIIIGDENGIIIHCLIPLDPWFLSIYLSVKKPFELLESLKQQEYFGHRQIKVYNIMLEKERT